MTKTCYSQGLLKLFSSALLIGALFLAPPNVFAGKNAADKAISEFDITITGTIRDGATGSALSGATIAVKGTATNTVSDANGSFSINVPDNSSVLVITYVGYATQEVTVGSNTNISVTLQSNAAGLGEVVVV